MLQNVKKHKIVFLLASIAVIAAGYYGYHKFFGDKTEVRYLTSAAVKGTLITSVSGSGQISVSNQIDIKPKVSGDITALPVKAGQTVKKDEIIARLDATEGYKAVRDAKANLESAQLSLDKLTAPATAEEIMQAENSLTSAQNTLDKLKLSQPTDYKNAEDALRNAKTALDKAYLDTFNNISNAFINLPNIMAELNDILYSEEISSSEITVGDGQLNTNALYNTTYETDQNKILSYQNSAESDYEDARSAYDVNLTNFRNVSIYSDSYKIENLLSETLKTAKTVSQAIKSENNYLSAWYDARTLRNWSVFPQVTTYRTNLSTYASQINTILSNLLTSQTTIQSNKDAITTADNNLASLKKNQPLDLAAAENSVKEKKAALAELKAGADQLDIRTQELSIQQKRNSLYDAKESLADYTIKAPFDGMIASVDAKLGDSASTATILATIVTQQQIAEIALNEVDAAKIQVGQKVTLTFDALDDLTVTGEVAEVDALGTVSQGVVTYTVKIVFDTQDAGIKSGMSVNAVIITKAKTDALYVSSSAVKTDSNGGSYVQVLDDNGQPQAKAVEIGIVNDTDTEIISGLSEGDKVITQTITSEAKTTAGSNSSSSSKRGVMGGPGMGF